MIGVELQERNVERPLNSLEPIGRLQPGRRRSNFFSNAVQGFLKSLRKNHGMGDKRIRGTLEPFHLARENALHVHDGRGRILSRCSGALLRLKTGLKKEKILRGGAATASSTITRFCETGGAEKAGVSVAQPKLVSCQGRKEGKKEGSWSQLEIAKKGVDT